MVELLCFYEKGAQYVTDRMPTPFVSKSEKSSHLISKIHSKESSRPIVHEQRIWYNACVLPKWEDHREAGTLTSRRRREAIPVAFSF